MRRTFFLVIALLAACRTTRPAGEETPVASLTSTSPADAARQLTARRAQLTGERSLLRIRATNGDRSWLAEARHRNDRVSDDDGKRREAGRAERLPLLRRAKVVGARLCSREPRHISRSFGVRWRPSHRFGREVNAAVASPLQASHAAYPPRSPAAQSGGPATALQSASHEKTRHGSSRGGQAVSSFRAMRVNAYAKINWSLRVTGKR